MSENTTTESTTAKARDYSQYETKAPSSLHKSFAEYIEAKTGHEADPKLIQLVLGLHNEYQASDERKAAREAEAAERKAAAEAAKASKKGGPRSKEAQELKRLLGLKAGLEKDSLPVPAALTKKIEAAQAEVEVPAQKSADDAAQDAELLSDPNPAVI